MEGITTLFACQYLSCINRARPVILDGKLAPGACGVPMVSNVQLDNLFPQMIFSARLQNRYCLDSLALACTALPPDLFHPNLYPLPQALLMLPCSQCLPSASYITYQRCQQRAA